MRGGMRTLLALTIFGLSAMAQDAPVASLAVNGSAAATIYRGWPAIASCRLAAPGDTGIRLAVPAKEWTAALRLGVRAATGEAQDWPWRLDPPATAEVTLDPGVSRQALWLLTPDDTVNLPEGEYTAAVAVDTTPKAASATIRLTVVPEPTDLTAGLDAAKTLLFAMYEEILGGADSAVTRLDALLTRQPDLVTAIVAKGDILLRAGNAAAALDAYDQAIEIVTKNQPRGAPPPRLLYQKLADAQESLAGK